MSASVTQHNLQVAVDAQGELRTTAAAAFSLADAKEDLRFSTGAAFSLTDAKEELRLTQALLFALVKKTVSQNIQGLITRYRSRV